MKEDSVYVKHILECMANVEYYTENDRNTFFNDAKTRDATLRQLQIMAESTTRLSNKFKDKNKSISWNQISGFRNIIVHDYLGDIDFDAVWRVVENRLPELKKLLSKALREMK